MSAFTAPCTHLLREKKSEKEDTFTLCDRTHVNRRHRGKADTLSYSHQKLPVQSIRQRQEQPIDTRRAPDMAADTTYTNTVSEASVVVLNRDDADEWINIHKLKKEKSETGKSTQRKKCWKSFRRNCHDENPLAAEQADLRASLELALQSCKHEADTINVNRIARNKSKRPASKRNVFPFLNLPRELRDEVYEEAIDLRGITTNIKNELSGYIEGMRHFDSRRETYKVQQLFEDLRQRHGNLKSPTILLINKQIHSEAQVILRKRTLVFEAPPVNNVNIFPFYQMVSRGLLRNVAGIAFEMQMKQHTEATMLGELEMGTNWISYAHRGNESLDNADAWAYFMFDCLGMLWAPGHNVRTLCISIVHKTGRREYRLEPTPSKLGRLEQTIKSCLETRNLDHFFSHLEYAEVPVANSTA
ncbi:uncharacterized protein PV09_01200 [Verruconis gallopava]|uniref:F-box domain-containing protein n=1 Tax=Verruconis gallopava TaxID=253628 RepID=A0A0D1XZP5_9PEZI|nr:uncharacterized protein PV09_01200 [Verruconis gallopava]KIW08281.1 hypothetical protein PV09_01200 [Verruconis gallopava]